MILVVLPEGGCWRTLRAPYGNMGGTDSRQSREVRDETEEETVEDRKTTDLPAVRE